MKVERIVHAGWKEVDSLTEEQKKGLTFALDLFGIYQYICTSEKGEISLIHIMTGMSTKKVWEIFCLEGNLFEDVDQFRTKKDAMDAIKGFLE